MSKLSINGAPLTVSYLKGMVRIKHIWMRYHNHDPKYAFHHRNIADSTRVLLLDMHQDPKEQRIRRTLDNHGASSSLTDRVARLTERFAYLRDDVTATVHADAEFRSTELYAWIRAQGYHAIIDISSETYIENIMTVSMEKQERSGTAIATIRCISHRYM